EVHVPRGVNHIENIVVAIDFPWHAHGLRFDGDPTFAFDVHVVKELALHIAWRNHIGILQHAVCKSGFAMVNMCDDTKVPNNRWIGRTGLRRVGRHWRHVHHPSCVYWLLVKPVAAQLNFLVALLFHVSRPGATTYRVWPAAS